jgi:hypothetical protein
LQRIGKFSGQSVSKEDDQLLFFFAKCNQHKELTNKTKELLAIFEQIAVTLHHKNNKVLSLSE